MISEKKQINEESNLQIKTDIFQEIYQKLINIQYIETENKFTAFNDLILYCYLYLPQLRDFLDVKSLQNHTKIINNFPQFNLSYQDMVDRYNFIDKNRGMITLSNVKQMKTFPQYDDIFECELIYDMNGEILLCTLDCIHIISNRVIEINDEEEENLQNSDENEKFNLEES